MDAIAVAQLPRVAAGDLARDVHEHVAEPPRAGPGHPGRDHHARSRRSLLGPADGGRGHRTPLAWEWRRAATDGGRRQRRDHRRARARDLVAGRHEEHSVMRLKVHEAQDKMLATRCGAKTGLAGRARQGLRPATEHEAVPRTCFTANPQSRRAIGGVFMAGTAGRKRATGHHRGELRTRPRRRPPRAAPVPLRPGAAGRCCDARCIYWCRPPSTRALA